MSKVKKNFKKDFKTSFKVDSKIDESSLEVNSYKVSTPRAIAKKSLKIATFCLVLILLGPIIFIATMFIQEKPQTRLYNKEYQMSVVKSMEEDSFRSLNQIQYPSPDHPSELLISEDFEMAMNDFALKVDENGRKQENYCYSPMMLYSLLHILSLGYENEEMIQIFDTVLGLNSSLRKENYINMYLNNFFVNSETGTTQMYHGAFLTNGFPYKQEYINDLTSHYVEAFQLDFNKEKDINKMIEWVNSKMQDDDFINKDDLSIEDDPILYLFSALYFSQKWKNRYYESDSYDDTFYINETQNDRVTYMNHRYLGKAYEYDKYYSVYDAYRNGYSVQYLVAKDDYKIDEAIQNQDIFHEDEEKRLTREVSLEHVEKDIFIDLTLPKLNMLESVDFKEILSELGLGDIFKPTFKNLDRVFSLKGDFAIEKIMQKNQVTFNEEGTIVKSLSFAGAGNAAPFDGKTLEVKLDHPYIYIIYDQNHLPLFVGHVDRPY